MQLILCCHCRMMTKKMMISLVWQVMADPKFIISLCDTSMTHWWLLNLHGFSVETAQKSLEELGGEALFLYVTVTMLTWQVNNMDSCLHRCLTLWHIPITMSCQKIASHILVSEIHSLRHLWSNHLLTEYSVLRCLEFWCHLHNKWCDLYKLNADIIYLKKWLRLKFQNHTFLSLHKIRVWDACKDVWDRQKLSKNLK